MSTAEPAPLKPHHLDLLRALHANPARTDVGPAILGMFRKRGLVGKVVGKDDHGRQKTTSPLTPAGLREIGVAS